MDKIFAPLRKALESENGYALAEVLSPIAPANDPGRLYAIARSSSAFTVQNELKSFIKYIPIDADSRDVWLDILLNYWKALNAILEAEEATNASSTPSTTSKTADWTKAYTSWRDLLNSLHRTYSQSHLEPWTLPLLYLVTKHLRLFAIHADDTTSPSATNASGLDDIAATTATSPDATSQANLEDAARQINRIFALVSQDRSPLPNRKYGTYYIATLLFKTYFRLHSLSLCKNIIRTIDASSTPTSDMPPLAAFPKAHQVTYRYFVGVVHFLEERYAVAEEHLQAGLEMCLGTPAGARQAERILIYLVPTRLITRHQLPSKVLLGRYERLGRLFGALGEATRRGDVSGFDRALEEGEEEFVRMRVYLTLERGRDVCLRNLLRRVYLAAGFEEGKGEAGGEKVRRSRIGVAEFRAGLRVVGEDLEGDEVEGLIAGMIYKNLMKGYISRQHSIVVLNKKGAFPGTGV